MILRYNHRLYPLLKMLIQILAVSLTLELELGTNADVVIGNIKQRLEKIQESLPEGVVIEPFLGALVVGRTLLEAFDRLEVLEATAEALTLSRPLGPLVPMPDAALAELRRAFGME